MSHYLIAGRHWHEGDAGLAEALREAHASHARPLCLCRRNGVPMYLARYGWRDGGLGIGASGPDELLIKRLPFTGPLHAPDCASYEPPAELSGLGQVLGSAITEDPASGLTALRLGFAMSRSGSRVVPPGSGEASDSVASDGSKLSLRGLLHYLWDQAELTHWHPGFAGKRSWGTVRRHLLGAAAHKVLRGAPLLQRLYVPEVFSVDAKDAIQARRMARFAALAGKTPNSRPLMLLIGELKAIEPARFGVKAVIKHVPDQAFAVDETLARRLERRLAAELALWEASETAHLVVIATFGVNAAGVPAIEELSVMPVTSQWIPVENSAEQQLVERLVRDGRSFVKGLRYNLGPSQGMASAVLTDAGEEPVALWIDGDVHEGTADGEDVATDATRWCWRVADGQFPTLPSRALEAA